ncbi:flagellar hook protein FlgE [Acidisoma silvae]|uniref:Flagellar hook protein FlgE n=1 Tax=Acidisoma silvae TaxID=2802396 RepID=A0A964DYC0_9PROT|nr:flagellar hook protein FlgE [Acidisoma silvae]MCB8874907.1 flagellar hook protein FlgE [Acidisoma silvae]
MSLDTAFSGLTAAQTGLDAVSNNLANANTTGFKSQLALFSDVFPVGESGVPGIGAQSAGIDTNLIQGTQIATGNNLDSMIQGSGYFVIDNNGATQYTRDGAFQLSNAGQLVTATGASVMGYPIDATTGTQSSTLQPMTVNTGSLSANATSKLGLTVSLNAADSQFASPVTPVPGDSSTYNETTSAVSYDSLGNPNTVNLYFQQEAPATAGGTPSWNVYAEPVSASGSVISAPSLLTTLTFNSSGALSSGSPATFAVDWQNGSAGSSVAVNFTGTTLGAQSFAIAGTTNNGYPPGNYLSTSVASDGSVEATYSNNQTQSIGTLALANFINPQGLQNVSGNLYAVTNTSGDPVINTPGIGQAGTLLSGNLEQSNVSTSSALVDLIQYQQAYQANATELQAEQQNFTKLIQI